MSRIRVPRSWSPEDALTVAYFLDDVARAIWKQHGHDMAELLQNLVDDGGVMPRAKLDDDPDAEKQVDIPF